MKTCELKPFLPTTEEIEKMDKNQFEGWISEASKELPKRAEIRDPLFHLKKRISNTLRDDQLSEEQREVKVLHEIERYKRVSSQPQ